MGDEVLILLRLFKDCIVLVSIVVNIIIGVGMFGGIVLILLYL